MLFTPPPLLSFQSWIQDELNTQKLQFYAYLQRIETEDCPVDGAQVMLLSVMLCRNITIISAEGVWSADPMVARDIVVVYLGDQQFTSAQVGCKYLPFINFLSIQPVMNALSVVV